MRITLDALLVLDAIERKGSFAAAATALHRVPSAVTYSVQKLEQDLNVKLFDRRGHRAALTAAGVELLHAGRHLLRAAQEAETRTQRIATGWEADLRIAVDDIVTLERVLPTVAEFYAGACGTRLRLSTEVLGGCWDALMSGRSDFVIGAPGDAPAGGGITIEPWADVEFVFAVAPQHPLATLSEPLPGERLIEHRAVAVADTSRDSPPRTSGLLSGQDVFIVPSMAAKLAAQRLGLGVGYVPRHWLAADIAARTLVIKEVEEPTPKVSLSLAWRSGHRGKALAWFVERLRGRAQDFLTV